MTLNDLAQGELWMDSEERQTAANLVQSLQNAFTGRQIPETPFLVLRVQDVLLHHTLCRRLERSLTPDPRHSREDGNPSSPAEVPSKLAEQIGKSRDRLRKSLKELEDTANKLDPAAPKTGAKQKAFSEGQTTPIANSNKACTPPAAQAPTRPNIPQCPPHSHRIDNIAPKVPTQTTTTLPTRSSPNVPTASAPPSPPLIPILPITPTPAPKPSLPPGRPYTPPKPLVYGPKPQSLDHLRRK